jgi:hypothetical protein
VGEERGRLEEASEASGRRRVDCGIDRLDVWLGHVGTSQIQLMGFVSE